MRRPAAHSSLLCVVESPADVLALEQAGGYRVIICARQVITHRWDWP